MNKIYDIVDKNYSEKCCLTDRTFANVKLHSPWPQIYTAHIASKKKIFFIY